MKFLKKPKQEDDLNERIEVVSLYELLLDCQSCGNLAKMKGGPTGDNKASFQCPDCNFINIIKWNIDL